MGGQPAWLANKPYGYSGSHIRGRLFLVDADGYVASEGDTVRIGGGQAGSDAAWLGCGGVTVVRQYSPG
jgi:hypothetical protein